ncbi:MAG: hypothetical protein PHP32_03335 [Candidatus Izemoplasmatales bacterium]|nr:hypothetical protein [Candidatus Izemoplasmatales bacterium]
MKSSLQARQRWIMTWVLVAFFLVIMPFMTYWFYQKVGIMDTPDTLFYYTPATLFSLANVYGSDGVAFYATLHFTFDVAFPVVYGLFFLLWFESFFQGSRILPYAKTAIVLGVLFDFVENIGVTIVMTEYTMASTRMDELALVTAIASGLKWLMILGSLGFMVFGMYQKKHRGTSSSVGQ